MRTSTQATLLAASAALIFGGCGGGGSNGFALPVQTPQPTASVPPSNPSATTDPSQPAIPQAAELEKSCPTLAGQTVKASDIGLPSGDATVTTSTLVAAKGALPEFCQLAGSISARTGGADAIRFQLNLPIAWNQKALMYGGGGFNGALFSSTDPLRDAPAGVPVPVAKGYATFSTDSGHDATTYIGTDPGKFALNDEMFTNFAHESYKKVKDAANVLIKRYYLRAASVQYFYGGSEGGREALVVAQRYPHYVSGDASRAESYRCTSAPS